MILLLLLLLLLLFIPGDDNIGLLLLLSLLFIRVGYVRGKGPVARSTDLFRPTNMVSEGDCDREEGVDLLILLLVW